MINVLEIGRQEFRKVTCMPAFYIFFIFCIVFNIYLFWNNIGYKLESINEDISRLQEDESVFVKEHYYDSYNYDKEAVLLFKTREKEYDDFTQSLIIQNHEKLNQRAKLMNDEERNSVSFTGIYSLHQRFYSLLFKWLLVESIVLIMLVVIYSMYYESNHNMEELALTCKYGRRIFIVKLVTAGLFAFALCMLLWLVCFGLYYTVIDYSGIWSSYISSNYNAGRRTVNDLYLYYFPFITWKPMTQLCYLFSSIGIMSLICLFATIASGVCAMYFKNSIKAVMVILGSVFLFYMFGNLIQPMNFLEFVLKFTPVHLVMKCGYWFMDYASGDSYLGYELLTISVWNIVMLVVLVTKYKRKNYNY